MSSDHASRARLYRNAFLDALSADDDGSEDGRMAALRALVVRCRSAASEDSAVDGALDAFEAIVRQDNLDQALAEASALFESPQRFREALFFLLCLDRDPAAALDLMRERAYLSGAVAPATTDPMLAADQARLLDAATFESLWQDPSRLASMTKGMQTWRQAYMPIYATAHAEYSQHVAAVVADIEAAQWQADALHKLNRLERLGEPVAQSALTRFHALEDLFACPASPAELAAEVEVAPLCPHCGYRLGEEAPVASLNETLIALDRGLASQQARLNQRVVARLVDAPGRVQEDRLGRFIRVVQAGDLSGLAQVLDEGLLEFLSDLLSTPEPRTNLIDRLAGDFPEVTHESLDAVVAAFRTLVEEELQRGHGRIVIGREDGA